MPRLIDAKVLRTCFTGISFDSLSSGELSIVLKFYDAIDNAPTIDAEPVRHGRWINKTERIYADLNYRFDCSACRHIFYAAGIETFKFCPNCGAKMRGDEDAAE